MNVQGFSHVTLNVSNLEKSLQFYEGILNMKVRHKGTRDVYLEWGAAWVCLQERPEKEKPGDCLGVDHIAFFIEEGDFHEAAALLQKKKIPIVRGPIIRGSGWTVNFLDPDGNQLELYTATLDQRLKTWK
ncbi:VOC family protein [Falsibacillus pallidus]|uniref:VOC family protein n=1 Tax=Falsibacillus pallidus TaxID=493781 RepID=UPI003D98CBED